MLRFPGGTLSARFLRVALLAVATSACSRPPADTPAYPPARTVNVVDRYHGVAVADPYRWLEDTTAEVRAWALAQTRFARPFLHDSVLRARLRDRMERLDSPWLAFDSALDAASQSQAGDAIRVANGRLVIGTPRGADRLLLDPATFGPATRLAHHQVAPNGRHVLVELAVGGDDWKVGRVVRVADGTLLPDSIPGIVFQSPLWTPDSKGILQVQYIHPASSERVMLRGGTLSYHQLGTGTANDVSILRLPANDVEGVIRVSLSSDGRRAFVSDGTGADFEVLGWALSRFALLELSQLDTPGATPALVAVSTTRDAAYAVVASDATGMLVLTDRDAPRHRLVFIPYRDPSPSAWRDVIPETQDVLLSVTPHGAHLLVVALRDAQHVLRIHRRSGALEHELTFPLGTRIELMPGATGDRQRILAASFLQPPRLVEVALSTGERTTMLETRSEFASADYVATQQWYAGKDGTRIPMWLVHRKGIALDGSHPTLLFGYGGSGTVMLPDYAPDMLAWLELGGVFAMPNLRGGGEFGRDWYEAAILGKKQTTFDDMIAAAEHLIARGYTSPSRLAIRGRSNGGRMVAAVMAERPDLFAAVVAEVPQTDNVRFDRGRHRAQFGSPSDSAQFGFLLATSPLHRVTAGRCYPATLVTTSLNDPRAPAWHAMKFTAALQAASRCARPIILQADTLGGHFSESEAGGGANVSLDYLTFLVKQLGMMPPR
ncbi:prolyl oligopeptidase family serine peptidase [Gemmatimonas groenlandica]|uniref:prolyl oligopeptidase n=1 Tax=Gemmatimonas groenlandica TaxID=2732249 RepID=A0A6M4IVU1_9BACT|nr:prolyl oligopeptidase family serine peptidase [Gemmatimonas groenlandica]QJR37636.1 S9 family peptidase [Gemmatimonas groenlandica]